MEYDPGCPLCRLCFNNEIFTRIYHDDEICIVVDCLSHRDKKMCVAKRHVPSVTLEEYRHMEDVMERLFHGIYLRHPRSILNHFHLHEK